ncbi:MAG: cytochrome c4 [Stappiaceae bacterium]
MVRAFLILLVTMFCLPAIAQDDFNLEETVELCVTCHGEDGVPIETDIPVIYGQEFFYIYTQLKDYSAGRRENEIMTDIAAEYTRSQLKEISQYFAEKPWPKLEASTQEGDASLAELAITGGQCSACHGKWNGDSRIPRLAGQQISYLEKTMQDFKNEVRLNAPDKISTMKQIEDPSIAALSRYLGAL